MTQLNERKIEIIIACAGGRKTSSLVEKALSTNKRVLFTTYTIENTENIQNYIISKVGYIPENITILSWYSFLIQHCIRPYKNWVIDDPKINITSVSFENVPDEIKRSCSRDTHPKRYYLRSRELIYRDRAIDFVCQANKKSGGLVIKRLSRIFDYILIDEAQDLYGYDFDFLNGILSDGKNIDLTIVADPRQKTYSTNLGQKRTDIVKWLKQIKDVVPGALTIKNECYRSNQSICDFADTLFPGFPKTISKNIEKVDHMGIFAIENSLEKVGDYITQYKPKVLRYDKRVNTHGFSAMNIGVAKGRTYDRVLIFPTKPMVKYLQTMSAKDAGGRPKFYVAITRAKHSVAFAVDKNDLVNISNIHIKLI